MRFFRWLYRLPGRIDRSFSSTALATNTEGPGAGVNQLNVPAATALIHEIENATTGEREEHEKRVSEGSTVASAQQSELIKKIQAGQTNIRR